MDYWIGMAVFTLIFGYYAVKYFRRSTRDQVKEWLEIDTFGKQASTIEISGYYRNQITYSYVIHWRII